MSIKVLEEDRQIIVHPYLLIEYNRRWYLIVAADNDGKILSFALTQIDKFVPLPSMVGRECTQNVLKMKIALGFLLFLPNE